MFDIIKYREIQEKISILGKKTKIIAISKNHTEEQVKLAISHNVAIFGENRVQEAKQKFKDILRSKNSIQMHLTGPLQTNKVGQALEIFDVFHTLDRVKLLKEFSKHQEKINKKKFYIQVNTGKEETKSGVYPENLNEFIKLCQFYNIPNIEGLMCIPPINEEPKKHFHLLKELAKEFNLSELSIGMSSDYIDALEYNPKYIRLGTILFGNRR